MYLALNIADKQTPPTSCRISTEISVLPAVLLLGSERQIQRRAISGFRPEVAENYTLMGYNAASSANFLPAFQDNLAVQSSGFKNPTILRVPENGTDRLSRNVGNKIPLLDI
jgi:hypothetical protein